MRDGDPLRQAGCSGQLLLSEVSGLELGRLLAPCFGAVYATAKRDEPPLPNQGRSVIPSRELATRFEAYSDWRRRLSAGISALHEWLAQQELADAHVDLKIQQLLERLHQ